MFEDGTTTMMATEVTHRAPSQSAPRVARGDAVATEVAARSRFIASARLASAAAATSSRGLAVETCSWATLQVERKESAWTCEPRTRGTDPMGDRIKGIDLSEKLERSVSDARIVSAQRRLTQLRLCSAGLLEPRRLGPGLLVIFEGFDAAGKGGAIRRLTASLDPRHVRVVPVGPPTPEERRHHFLWRFQAHLPGQGEMTVFDRSWYGRLLVEVVDEGLEPALAKRSAQEITDIERALVDDGVTIVKFWLHISDAEQLRRFNDRANNPLKHWKLTPDDWHNRSQRAAYLDALTAMVDATDHAHAHWDLVAAENKHYARAVILETLISRWVHDLERRGYEVPADHEGDYLH